jgi:hypothetical protein
MTFNHSLNRDDTTVFELRSRPYLKDKGRKQSLPRESYPLFGWSSLKNCINFGNAFYSRENYFVTHQIS